MRSIRVGFPFKGAITIDWLRFAPWSRKPNKDQSSHDGEEKEPAHDFDGGEDVPVKVCGDMLP